MRSTLTQLHAEQSRKAKNATANGITYGSKSAEKNLENGSSSEDEEPLARTKVLSVTKRTPDLSVTSSSSSSSGESGNDDDDDSDC